MPSPSPHAPSSPADYDAPPREAPPRKAAFARRAAVAAVLLGLGGAVGNVAADPFSTPEGVPRSVTYQGYLTQSGAAVTDDLHTLRFQLFTTPTGGTALWTSVRAVATSAGHFAVTLGDTANGQLPLVLTDFAGGDLYLEIAVQTGVSTYEVVGRQRVTSVPYALRAATARSAENASAAESVTAGTVTISTSCTYRPDHDNRVYCDCGAGKIAISGGGDCPAGYVLRASMNAAKWTNSAYGPTPNRWVTYCTQAGVGDAAINDPHALCIQTTP